MPMLLIALALAAAPASPRRECRASAPAGCATVNPLIDHGLPERLRQFLRGARASYLYEPRRFLRRAMAKAPLVSGQILDVLGGPPNPRIDLHGGFLFTACRWHSCIEKGGLVVDPKGRILAVAIVHFEAGRSREPRLNIYARSGIPRSGIRMLKSWADRAVSPDRIAQRTVTRV